VGGFPRGDSGAPDAGLASWLAFLRTSGATSGAFACYDPRRVPVSPFFPLPPATGSTILLRNIQTRFLSSRASAFGKAAVGGRGAPDVDVALRTLAGAWVAGAVDVYRESTCVFRARATGATPKFCVCGARTRGPTLARDTHGLTTKRDYDALPRATRDALLRLSPLDALLYDAVLDRAPPAFLLLCPGPIVRGRQFRARRRRPRRARRARRLPRRGRRRRARGLPRRGLRGQRDGRDARAAAAAGEGHGRGPCPSR